MEIFTDYGMT